MRRQELQLTACSVVVHAPDARTEIVLAGISPESIVPVFTRNARCADRR